MTTKEKLEIRRDYLQNKLNYVNNEIQKYDSISVDVKDLVDKYDYDNDGVISTIDLSILPLIYFEVITESDPLFDKDNLTYNGKLIDLNKDGSVGLLDILEYKNAMISIIKFLDLSQDFIKKHYKDILETNNETDYDYLAIEKFYQRNNRLPSLIELDEYLMYYKQHNTWPE